MSAISHVVANKLFELCNWAHETWVLHRTLFDDNEELQQLGVGRHAHFLHDLRTTEVGLNPQWDASGY